MLGYAVLLHFVGDYLIQTNWMANEKVKRWVPAVAHGVTYTLPFLLLTRSIPALLVICLTHIVIDHYRLAKHFIWAKNLLSPRERVGWIAEWDGVDKTYETKYDSLDSRMMRPIHKEMSTAPPWAKPIYKPQPSWAEAKENGGFAKSTPVWMATWLMIITDNVIHILINAAALTWL